ncbi:MAG: DUF465 domain-containing protein [bacterium]|nr:DUF465 domain-containing protein [bacterium]
MSYRYEEEIKASLRETNREFRRLESLHKQYEQELESLARSRYLSQDQEVKKTELKKLKLQVKDRMAQIIRQYSSSKQSDSVISE